MMAFMSRPQPMQMPFESSLHMPMQGDEELGELAIG